MLKHQPKELFPMVMGLETWKTMSMGKAADIIGRVIRADHPAWNDAVKELARHLDALEAGGVSSSLTQRESRRAEEK